MCIRFYLSVIFLSILEKLVRICELFAILANLMRFHVCVSLD